jgi:hypothetical protein
MPTETVSGHLHIQTVARWPVNLERAGTLARGDAARVTNSEGGTDDLLPSIGPPWSPMARFGGFQTTPPNSTFGVRQGQQIGDASAVSEELLTCRRDEGLPAFRSCAHTRTTRWGDACERTHCQGGGYTPPSNRAP